MSVQVAGNHTDWTTAAAGDFHTCARRSTSRLYFWGFDNSGELGNDPALTIQPTPVEVAA